MFSYVKSSQPNIPEDRYTHLDAQISKYCADRTHGRRQGIEILPVDWSETMASLCETAHDFWDDCIPVFEQLLHAKAEIKKEQMRQEGPPEITAAIFTLPYEADETISDVEVRFAREFKFEIWFRVHWGDRYLGWYTSKSFKSYFDPADLPELLQFIFPALYDFFATFLPAALAESKTYPNFDTESRPQMMDELKALSEKLLQFFLSQRVVSPNLYIFPHGDEPEATEPCDIDEGMKRLVEQIVENKNFTRKRRRGVNERGYTLTGYIGNLYKLEIMLSYLPRYEFVEFIFMLDGNMTRERFDYREDLQYANNKGKTLEEAMPVFSRNVLDIMRELERILAPLAE